MRKMLAENKEILRKLDNLERKDIAQDEKIKVILDYLKQLEEAKEKELEQKRRPRIGFKP